MVLYGAKPVRAGPTMVGVAAAEPVHSADTPISTPAAKNPS